MNATRTVCLSLLVALCLLTAPLSTALASGVFWHPTKTSSDSSFDHLNPALVAYHNHAYILSVRVNGSSAVTSVFFTTNESGHWATQLLSNQGPANTYSGEFVSLTADPSTGRLYAAWMYHKSTDTDAMAVWTRDVGGQWTGPTDVATAGFLGGQPSIVAENGKAFVAFISSNFAGACDDSTSRNGDVQIIAYNGSSWSAPQNLTSCVSDATILEFANPKLAMDESGRVYLVSSANGNLWYDENASGSWSDPALITQGANIPESVGTALRTYYGIAASNGIAYVTYVRLSGSFTYDVLLMTHSVAGSWSSSLQVSPGDSQGCPKFGVSIVANAGRVGVSYVRGHTGYCHGSTGIFGNVPFLFTGTPGHMAGVQSLVGSKPDCFYTSVSNERNLFRFVTACDHPTSIGKGQLYYKAEFLDVIGPVAHLSVPAHSSSTIHLHWTARDPQPGSGVAYYQLRMSKDGGSFRTLATLTQARSFVYPHAVSGHRYAFRVRARDRTANWGAWVAKSTLVR